jgi:uncharacterized protein (TIGR03067 family)
MKPLLHLLLIVSVGFVLLSCAGRPPVHPSWPAALGAVTSFAGKWREIKNENQPVIGDKTWAFEGKTITIKDGGRTYTGTFTYREDCEPKEIDIQFEGYPVNKAIYAIDGNVMHIMCEKIKEAPTRAEALPDRELVPAPDAQSHAPFSSPWKNPITPRP